MKMQNGLETFKPDRPPAIVHEMLMGNEASRAAAEKIFKMYGVEGGK